MSEEQDEKTVDDYVSSPSLEEESEEESHDEVETVETPEPVEYLPQQEEKSELPEGLKKRLSKLTADRHRLKSANEEKDRKLAELESRVQGYEAEQPERPSRPTLEDDDVDYDEDKLATKMDQYYENLADWKTQQRIREYEQKGAVDRIQEKKRKLATDFQARVEESGIEDYDSKLDKLINEFEQRKILIPDHFVESIQLAEQGPKIVEYFSSEPSKAIEISKKGVVQAALEIGKISAKISAGKPLQATRAPKPVKPVKGSGVKPQDTESYTVNDWVEKDLSHLGFTDR